MKKASQFVGAYNQVTIHFGVCRPIPLTNQKVHLLVLLTMGTPVKIEHLEEALISFLKINQYKFQIPFDSILFSRSLKELENTFIKTQKDSYNTIAVQYQNPSIQDFLVNYLRDKKDLTLSLIESAIYQEQFFTVFTTVTSDENTLKKKILLGTEAQELTFLKISEKFKVLKNCRAIKYKYSNNESFTWGVNTDNQYQFLNRTLSELSRHNSEVSSFVKEQFKELIYLKDLSYSEQSAYISLLSTLNIKDIDFNEEQLIDSFLNEIRWLDNLELFSKLEQHFPTTYQDTVNDSSFSEKIEKLVKEEIERVEDSDMENLKSQIESIESEFNLDLNEYVTELGKKISDFNDYIDSQVESYIEDGIDKMEDREFNEEILIEEIFKSLADE